jgi:hypothetical protein
VGNIRRHESNEKPIAYLKPRQIPINPRNPKTEKTTSEKKYERPFP